MSNRYGVLEIGTSPQNRLSYYWPVASVAEQEVVRGLKRIEQGLPG